MSEHGPVRGAGEAANAFGATVPEATTLTPTAGGVCAVEGIAAGGLAAGLKPSGRPDLAVVAAPRTVAAGAVQTTNAVAAAPVHLTRRHLAATEGRGRAILLNAGSANACTGPDGADTARASAVALAERLGCAPEEVLVASTGVIGQPIPRETLLAGIPALVADAAPDADGARRAAEAIRTTDTWAKEAAVTVADPAGTATVGGLAKGSGMIDPAMATMLAVITTDADLRHPTLASVLSDVVARTFGRISVDGCQSTNDAVVLLATGEQHAPPALGALVAGLEHVCGALAEQIVRDGEGATRTLHVHAVGAETDADAEVVARAVAGSDLVRTAVAGGDPNWGRVLAAVGAAGAGATGLRAHAPRGTAPGGEPTIGSGDQATGPRVPRVVPERLDVRFGAVTVCRFGAAASFDAGQAAAALRGPDVHLTVDLGLGEGRATVLTCDLTHGYISINAEYTT